MPCFKSATTLKDDPSYDEGPSSVILPNSHRLPLTPGWMRSPTIREMKAARPNVDPSQGIANSRHVAARSLDRYTILNIAEMCDTPTKAALCGLSRELRGPLQRSLFRCVDIQGSNQLDAFVRCVGDVHQENDTDSESTNRMRTLLAQVECFVFRPFIPCRLFLYYTPEDSLLRLCQIPRRTKTGKAIFPRLQKAKLAFDRPPYPMAALVDSHTHPRSGGSNCFLSVVKQLSIDKHTVETFQNACPALEDLGIHDVTSVHLACGYRQAPHAVVARSLRGQTSLETVVLHIEDQLTFKQGISGRRRRIEHIGTYAKEVANFLRAFTESGRWPRLARIVMVVDDDQALDLIPCLAQALWKGMDSARVYPGMPSPGEVWRWMAERLVIKSASATERPLLDISKCYFGMM